MHTAASGDTRGLNPEEMKALAALPGIIRADFFRSSQLMLDPGRPPVALIARPIDMAEPGNTLPLTDEVIPPATASEGRDTYLGIRSNG